MEQKGAGAGSLAIMVGGDKETFKAAFELLFNNGSPCARGPNRFGSTCQLANQTIVGITIGAVAEAMYLLEKVARIPLLYAMFKGGFGMKRSCNNMARG